MMDKQEARRALAELNPLLSTAPIFAIQGTALGFYRDEGFTPDERDIDFGLLWEDFTKFVKLALPVLHSREFNVRTESQPFTLPRVLVASRGTVKIDFVSYVRYKQKRFCHNTDRKAACGPYAVVHDAEMLEHHRKIKVFDMVYRIPERIEEYLELEYGSDWRTPKQDSVSKTRIYKYLEKEAINVDYLAQARYS